jgi:hypothetical protein
MNDQPESVHTFDPLDKLTAQLLECGGVLSQIVGHMVKFEASGHAAPDLAPIPEVARTLIRVVLDELRKRHSRRDILVAAKIVAEATETICENIFFVDPELN